MPALRRRPAMSFGGVLVLAALMLVPLLLRGHHAGHASAGQHCATCVVVKHTPTVSSVGPVGVTPVLARVAVPTAPLARPARHDRPVETVRGPPLPHRVG